MSDVIEKQIASAWVAEAMMKTKTAICPLTLDLSQPLPERAPFYYVHSLPGGGGAEMRYLAKFWEEQPIIAIQMPMDGRKFVADIDPLIEDYCNLVLTFHQTYYGNRGFLLGGWSAGAIIALEMAQRLAKIGRIPELLIAIDKAPRNTSAEMDPIYGSMWRNSYLWWRLHWRKRDLLSCVLNKIAWYLRTGHLYGSETSNDDKKRYFAGFKHRTDDEKAFQLSLWEGLEKYVPQPYGGKVLVIMTREGHQDRVADGWRTLVKGPLIIKIAGTHLSIMEGRLIDGDTDLADVRGLASALRRGVRALAGKPQERRKEIKASPWGPKAFRAS